MRAVTLFRSVAFLGALTGSVIVPAAAQRSVFHANKRYAAGVAD